MGVTVTPSRTRLREPFSALEKLALLGEIAATYLRVRRLVRSRPLPEAVATLRRARRARTGAEPEVAHLVATRLGWAVQKALALLPGDTRCLVQSLVLTALLARRAIPSTLVIGVARGGTFTAHAWVECGGVPALPPRRGAFERLTEL